MQKMIDSSGSGSSDAEIDEAFLDAHLCTSGYSPDTVSKEPYGPGGIWTSEDTEYPKVNGRHEDYKGSAFMVQLSTDADTLVEQVDFLKENDWIDKSTRAIMVVATFVNPNINVYTVGELLLELPPGGDYLATQHYFTYRVELYSIHSFTRYFHILCFSFLAPRVWPYSLCMSCFL